MIELLLVRHGNTFAPGDRIVWVVVTGQERG